MRKNWLIALVGAALLAIVPATALAQGHHARHHAKRHHRVRTHLRHITAASSGTTGTSGMAGNNGTTTGSGTSSTDSAGTVTSFDSTTGKLVITLTDHTTVSGMVNGNTELKCESASTQSSGAPGSMQSDSSRDGGGDPNSGNTQSSSGDQSSNPGHDGQGDQGDQGNQNDQNDQNDQGDLNEQGDNGQANCTTANLTPGTVVHEAELSVSSAGSVWRQVDLVLS